MRSHFHSMKSNDEEADTHMYTHTVQGWIKSFTTAKRHSENTSPFSDVDLTITNMLMIMNIVYEETIWMSM